MILLKDIKVLKKKEILDFAKFLIQLIPPKASSLEFLDYWDGSSESLGIGDDKFLIYITLVSNPGDPAVFYIEIENLVLRPYYLDGPGVGPIIFADEFSLKDGCAQIASWAEKAY